MMEILYKFNQAIIIKHCSEALGLVSPKQKILIKNVKDHHKAFDFLMILNSAVDQELTHHVIKELKVKGIEVKLDNLQDEAEQLLKEWSECNENLAYVIILRRLIKAVAVVQCCTALG